MTSTLRISIVGNKDLKHSLSHDKKYIPGLIQSIVAQPEESSSLIDSLIIIKFLIQFNHHCIRQFHDDFVQLNDTLCQIVAGSLRVGSFDAKLGHLLVDIINLIHLKPKNHFLFRYILTILTIEYDHLSEDIDHIILKSIDLIPVLQMDPKDPLFLVLYHKIVQKLGTEIGNVKNNLHDPENLKNIYKLLLNLNHMLSKQIIQDLGLSLDENLQEKMSFLFQFDNGYLNLNIIKLFFFFDIENNYIYKLIELIDDNEYKINSFNIISELVKKNDQLTDDLLKFKIDIKLIDYLNKYLPSKQTDAAGSRGVKNASLEYLCDINLPDLLLLISLLTYNNEELRNKFVEGYNFKPLINKVLALYKSKLIALAKNVAANESEDVIKDSVSILKSKLFLNLFKLIRSFSRSIKILRKFFITLNLMDNLVDILEVQSLLSLNNDIELINLSIFTNTILDFSSFRSSMTSDKRFIWIILRIYQDHSKPNRNIYDNQIRLIFLQFVKNLMYNENEQTKMVLSRELISMDEIVDYLSYDEQYKDEEMHNLKLQQKLVMFDILRNLSSNSNYFNQNLYKSIERKSKLEWNQIILQNVVNISSFQHFDRFNMENFLKMSYNDSYIELLSSINYIENHKILTIKELVVDEDLIMFWKMVLDSTVLHSDKNIQKCSFNLNSIKLSIIWIFLNITWPDKNIRFCVLKPQNPLITPGFDLDIKQTLCSLREPQQYEILDLRNTVERCKWLDSIGFCKTLYDVSRTFDLARNETINSDLREKAQAVVEQIDGFLTEKNDEPVGDTSVDVSADISAEAERSGNDSDYDIDSYWVN